MATAVFSKFAGMLTAALLQRHLLGFEIAQLEFHGSCIAEADALMTESKEKLKSVFMKVKKESAGLKLNIQKTNIMASGPITSWQIDEETVETETSLVGRGVVVGAPKSLQMVTAAMKFKDTCSLEEKLWPT